MQRRTFLQLCAASSAGLIRAVGAQRRTPNVILIYADDLGYGDVGCYGATLVKTPNVDRLAREGVRFTDAHSSSATCTPSRYSLMTGQYAWRKKGTRILPGDAALILDTTRPTLASVFKQAGYNTGYVGQVAPGSRRGQLGLERRDPARPAGSGVRLLLSDPSHGRPRPLRLRREPPRSKPGPGGPHPRQLPDSAAR